MKCHWITAVPFISNAWLMDCLPQVLIILPAARLLSLRMRSFRRSCLLVRGFGGLLPGPSSRNEFGSHTI